MGPIGKKGQPLYIVSHGTRRYFRAHTGRLVEVTLQYVFVEDQQSFQNLESVLIGRLLPDLEVEVLIRQGLFRL
jgi:hypothetical protein